LANANLLKIGLQYTQDFDGLVIALHKMKYKGNGVANEGIVSTRLGLKEFQLSRRTNHRQKLVLLEYTGEN
jgi:dihydroorotase